MRAIILAAGRGQRLAGSPYSGQPKCLIEVGGKSLLQRQLGALGQLGVGSVDLVVGYQAGQIQRHVEGLSDRPAVAFHENPNFDQGSAVSLSCAGEVLRADAPTLVLDADVLFHPHILKRLLESGHGNCFLLDRQFEPGDEPVKIAIADGTMIEFRKQLDPDLAFDFIGESVGFFRFDAGTSAEIAGRCEDYLQQGRFEAPHEEVLRDALLHDPRRFGFEDITGLPWLEIDFRQDAQRASSEILPAIRNDIADF